MFVIVGSLGMMAFATKFGFSSDLDGYRLSPVRFFKMNGAQVWSVSWSFILIGTVLQGSAAWRSHGTPPTLTLLPSRILNEKPIVNSWDRTRQCADQVERMTSRERWSEGGRQPGVRAFDWSNHYSQEFQRCFVKVSYFNDEAKTDKNQPLIVYILYDAFENRGLATCTDATNAGRENFCSTSDDADAGKCAACRQFVIERMTK